MLIALPFFAGLSLKPAVEGIDRFLLNWGMAGIIVNGALAAVAAYFLVLRSPKSHDSGGVRAGGQVVRIYIFLAVLSLAACRDGRDASPAATEESAAGGAVSPDGERHPGKIVHDDKVDGRVWTRSAGEVPVGIAWADVDGQWIPVVRIEITGTADRRTMTAFGVGGRVLQRTVQAP